MAVTRIATPHEYVGLSTDVKPTTAAPLAGEPPPPAGSLFFERNTGITYIYDGSAWGSIVPEE